MTSKLWRSLLNPLAFGTLLACIVGCTTKLTKSERELLISQNIMMADISGLIKVDATDSGSPLERRSSWIKSEIVAGIIHDGHKYHETEDGPVYVFRFEECVTGEYFPFNNLAVNGLIHVGTLFLYPIGQKYTCRAELHIQLNKHSPNHLIYSAQVDTVYEGHLFLYLSPIRVPSFYGVTELLSRKLFHQYQLDANKPNQ